MKPYRLLLSGVSFLELTSAWGPIFEPLRGGGEGFAMRLMMLQDSSTEQDNNNEPTTTTTTFTLDFRDSRRSLDGDFVPRLFISRPLLVDFDVFGVVNPFEQQQQQDHERTTTNTATQLQISPEEDEDEEDCVIPDEYKRLKPEDAAYVLDYLGIQRAKPVQSSLQHLER